MRSSTRRAMCARHPTACAAVIRSAECAVERKLAADEPRECTGRGSVRPTRECTRSCACEAADRICPRADGWLQRLPASRGMRMVARDVHVRPLRLHRTWCRRVCSVVRHQDSRPSLHSSSTAKEEPTCPFSDRVQSRRSPLRPPARFPRDSCGLTHEGGGEALIRSAFGGSTRVHRAMRTQRQSVECVHTSRRPHCCKGWESGPRTSAEDGGSDKA